MPRRNPQPAWRAAVVGLVWSVFMYYCIYRQPLRDLTERLTRSDTVDKPFILGAITLPIVALCDKIKLEEFLWASAILYHATSTFCKVAPNTTAFFVGQVFAGASASSVIYGYNFLFSAINV
ncbi:unnamed protein product [Clonostachys rhizophaga]|uniref:Uncharacterized protein n=1 Tax=Clonostachys rhizophaga TaxID=160324 RepID=A0A9N9VGT1_9HYPO|nr:unnamed protein product [Clonostachys rhizophaga]